MFPFLVCAYIPSNVGAQAPSFIPQNSMLSLGNKTSTIGDWRKHGIVSGERTIESFQDQKNDKKYAKIY